MADMSDVRQALRQAVLGLGLALGAAPGEVQRLVLKQVGVMALIGGVLGLIAAIGLGRASEALLFGITGYDPLVLVVAVIILSTVVLGAGYLPARRASKLAPMDALRHD
jgi:putative ABC transport system permease protein